MKRALREAFWGLADRLPAGYDFVIVARPELGELIEREGSGGVAASIEEALPPVLGEEAFHVKRIVLAPLARLPALDLPVPPPPLPLRADLLGLRGRGGRPLRRGPRPRCSPPGACCAAIRFSHGGFDPVPEHFTLRVGPVDPGEYHGEAKT